MKGKPTIIVFSNACTVRKKNTVKHWHFIKTKCLINRFVILFIYLFVYLLFLKGFYACCIHQLPASLENTVNVKWRAACVLECGTATFFQLGRGRKPAFLTHSLIWVGECESQPISLLFFFSFFLSLPSLPPLSLTVWECDGFRLSNHNYPLGLEFDTITFFYKMTSNAYMTKHSASRESGRK